MQQSACPSSSRLPSSRFQERKLRLGVRRGRPARALGKLLPSLAEAPRPGCALARRGGGGGGVGPGPSGARSRRTRTRAPCARVRDGQPSVYSGLWRRPRVQSPAQPLAGGQGQPRGRPRPSAEEPVVRRKYDPARAARRPRGSPKSAGLTGASGSRRCGGAVPPRGSSHRARAGLRQLLGTPPENWACRG